MKRKIIQFIFTTVTLGIIYITSISFSTGPPVGAVTGGCTCHGAANANTLVTISFNNGGAMVYNNGQTYPIVVTVNSQTNKPGAGFAMSFNIGTLTPTTPGTAIVGNVWRHNTPRLTTGANPSTASWTANWTAPPTGSTLLQLKAAGNAVSLSNGSALDQWNFAGNVNIPLPVYFESLTVSAAGTNNHIEWEVVSEKNISEYQIQKSINGSDFSSIHTMTALNSEEKHSYSWDDISSETSTVQYYRILAKDIDGKDFYSVTKSIRRNPSGSGNMVFPNVVSRNGTVNVALSMVNSGDEILIMNSFGMVHSRTSASLSTTTLITDQLSAGIYYVILKSNDSRVLIDKLLIR